MTTQIAVRLSDELVGKIDGLVSTSQNSRSEIVRQAIEAYLYRKACEDDAFKYEATPLSDSELALADDSSGWEITPGW